MRHHWLAIVPKNSIAKQGLAWRIQHRVIPMLIWKPEQVYSAELDHGIFALSFSSNCELFGYSSPVSTAPDGLTFVSGLPTLEDFGQNPDSNVPSEVRKLLDTSSPQEFYLQAGGVWSVLNVKNDQICAFSDFSGYHSLFYCDTDDYFAISNKSGLVAALATKGNTCPEPNYAALSWVFSTTMVQGHETAFKSVHKLRPGSVTRYSAFEKHLQIKAFKRNFYSPLRFVSGKSGQAFLTDRIDSLSQRTKWLVERGLPLQTHLTGGKDTRVVLGLLHRSGSIDNLRSIQTTGNEDNGDVIIARRIANKIGIEKRHIVRRGNKGSNKRTAEEVTRALLHSFAKYDGQVTPFDGRQSPFMKFPNEIAFMGGGGEILRQKDYKNHSNLKEICAQFENWSYRFDALEILSGNEKHRQRAEIVNRAAELLENNILNHQAKYYIDHRLSNWGCGHFQANPGNTIPLLIDIGLTRLMFTQQDMGENIHFELLRQTCPQLLDISFFNQRWLGATKNLAAKYGYDPDPYEASVERSFPWQFEAYRTRRCQLVRLILDFWPQDLGQYLDRRKVERLIGQPLKFNSAHIKMLMGLASTLAYFRASKYGIAEDPDIANCESISIGGNYLQSELRNAVLRKESNVMNHPASIHILAHLSDAP